MSPSIYDPTIEFLQHRARACRALADYVRNVDDTDPLFASAAEYDAFADDAILAVRVLMREQAAKVIGGAS